VAAPLAETSNPHGGFKGECSTCHSAAARPPAFSRPLRVRARRNASLQPVLPWCSLL